MQENQTILEAQLEATLVSATYMLLARTDAIEVVQYIRDMMKRMGLESIERQLSPNADLTPAKQPGPPKKTISQEGQPAA